MTDNDLQDIIFENEWKVQDIIKMYSPVSVSKSSWDSWREELGLFLEDLCLLIEDEMRIYEFIVLQSEIYYETGELWNKEYHEEEKLEI